MDERAVEEVRLSVPSKLDGVAGEGVLQALASSRLRESALIGRLTQQRGEAPLVLGKCTEPGQTFLERLYACEPHTLRRCIWDTLQQALRNPAAHRRAADVKFLGHLRHRQRWRVGVNGLLGLLERTLCYSDTPIGQREARTRNGMIERHKARDDLPMLTLGHGLIVAVGFPKTQENGKAHRSSRALPQAAFPSPSYQNGSDESRRL